MDRDPHQHQQDWATIEDQSRRVWIFLDASPIRPVCLVKVRECLEAPRNRVLTIVEGTQQMASYSPQPGMMRGAESMYGTPQQSTHQSSPTGSMHEFAASGQVSGMATARQNLSQGQGYTSSAYAHQPVSSTGESSALNPIAPAFHQYGPQHYENVSDPTQYSYTQNPQYRQQGYSSLPASFDRTVPSSSTLLEQPLTSTLPHRPQDGSSVYAPGAQMPQQQQYGDPQGYQGTYDSQQRTEYPTPTTQSGRW